MPNEHFVQRFLEPVAPDPPLPPGVRYDETAALVLDGDREPFVNRVQHEQLATPQTMDSDTKAAPDREVARWTTARTLDVETKTVRDREVGA